MHRIMMTAIISLSIVLAMGEKVGLAQAEVDVPSAIDPVNSVSWSRMTLRIADSDGQPISGAKVRPWAVRAGGGHGAWNEKVYGRPKATTTDAKGQTEIEFPVQHSWALNDAHPVTTVTVTVTHPQFCAKNAHAEVPQADPLAAVELVMQRGVTLRIAGVLPGSDQPLPDCHLKIEGADTAVAEFERQPDNWLQTMPIQESRRWFRVIYLPPGQPPQFSIPQAWDPEDVTSREARVVVRPGVRVVGKISDDVPRPITRGHVGVRCGSPAPRENEGKSTGNRPIMWLDFAPIAKDGSFEFSSLPSGFLGQFYALADDYVSAQPTDEAYENCCKWFGVASPPRGNFFRYAQILRLAGTESRFTIQMEPAGQVRLKCVDPMGNPLAGVKISSWPNQFTIGGGSWLFCSRISSQERLRDSNRTDWGQDDVYTVKTNQDGEGVIKSLPVGKQSFHAEHEFWFNNEEQSAISHPGATTELTVTMKRSR